VKRALQIAAKSKLPKVLTYTIQKAGAIRSDESKKALKELNERLGKSDSHENH
jgi:hypothetical protein